MADENEMREFFERFFDEHGFDPESNDYQIVHHKVLYEGELHEHTHLIAIPKKKGDQNNDI